MYLRCRWHQLVSIGLCVRRFGGLPGHDVSRPSFTIAYCGRTSSARFVLVEPASCVTKGDTSVAFGPSKICHYFSEQRVCLNGHISFSSSFLPLVRCLLPQQKAPLRAFAITIITPRRPMSVAIAFDLTITNGHRLIAKNQGPDL